MVEPVRVSIFRPFFTAGIVIVLTTGCLLGALALAGIARAGSYTTGTWPPMIQAHANAQLYGWIGFFVLGFALQQHPPDPRYTRLYYRLAGASLGLLALAIPLRFAAEAGLSHRLGVASGAMQALAVLLFAVNSGRTRHRAVDPETGRTKPLPWQSKFVFAALAWWTAVALAEPWFFAQTHTPDPAANVAFIARWFGPYREAQFVGFVPMMVFGVALSRLPADFGLAPACRPLGETGFLLWHLGLGMRFVGWGHLFDAGGAPRAAVLYHAGGVVLAIAAACLIASSGLLTAPQPAPRAWKFIRAALCWLLCSGALMALEPLHLTRLGMGFSHAYTGAIRHAVTVGFLSQMIVGVSLHLVPRFRPLNALASRADAPLSAVFWLLNLGNASRVLLEIATDLTRAAFAPMGATGFIEWTALALWAVHLAPWLLSPTEENP